MNIVIDPRVPGALGSFGFDDEGTPATPRYAVHNGQWVGVLAGRDSAAVHHSGAQPSGGQRLNLKVALERSRRNGKAHTNLR